LANVFSQQKVEMEHEREVDRCQLQKQSEDISSVLDVLSALSHEMKTLHQTLSEHSQWWLQVWFSFVLNMLQLNI